MQGFVAVAVKSNHFAKEQNQLRWRIFVVLDDYARIRFLIAAEKSCLIDNTKTTCCVKSAFIDKPEFLWN